MVGEHLDICFTSPDNCFNTSFVCLGPRIIEYFQRRCHEPHKNLIREALEQQLTTNGFIEQHPTMKQVSQINK